MSHVILNEWLYPFIARIINIHRSGVLIALFGCCVAGAMTVKLLPSRRKFCVYHSTMHPFTVSLHSKPHRQGVCVFGCNLPPALLAEWPGFLRATGVTRGSNGYRNNSQHRKLTLEKKILPPLLPGLEPGTFRSRVRRSNHWAIPAPRVCLAVTCHLHYWRKDRDLLQAAAVTEIMFAYGVQLAVSSQPLIQTYSSTHTIQRQWNVVLNAFIWISKFDKIQLMECIYE